MEDWHRWLGTSGDQRTVARAVTGASNLAFFFLALTGPYLWVARARGRGPASAASSGFEPHATAARAIFNWHNTIGLWCAPILVVLTMTGVVMSYPWANALLFRVAGSPPPVSGGGGGPAAARGGEERSIRLPENLDAIWARATEQVPTWRSITARLPTRSGAPVTFTIVDAPLVECVRALAAHRRCRDRRGVEVGAVRRHQPWTEMARLGALRSYRRARRSSGSGRRRSCVRRRRDAGCGPASSLAIRRFFSRGRVTDGRPEGRPLRRLRRFDCKGRPLRTSLDSAFMAVYVARRHGRAGAAHRGTWYRAAAAEPIHRHHGGRSNRRRLRDARNQCR